MQYKQTLLSEMCTFCGRALKLDRKLLLIVNSCCSFLHLRMTRSFNLVHFSALHLMHQGISTNTFEKCLSIMFVHRKLTILINHEYSLVFLLVDVTHYFNIYHVLQSGQQRVLSRQLAAWGFL